MVATLKAKKPESARASKPKIIIYGRSGVGKTWTAMDFPKPYYIDTEGGANLAHYLDKLTAVGGAYLGPEDGANDFTTVIDQVIALASTKHDYQTLIIDSFSKLYNTEAGIAEEKVGNDFGRDKKEAQRPTKKLIRWLEKLDMTVILICHEKDQWSRTGGDLVCTGQTFDGWDKLEYELHLCLQIKKQGNSRKAYVKKSRLTGFPDGDNFEWNYPEFADRFGRDVIESQPVTLEIATAAQVAELKALIELMQVPADEYGKWLSKAGVEDFNEMDEPTIQKCIAFLKSKIAKLTAEKQEGLN